MKQLEIRKQPRMGLSRALTMTMHSIRYRLLRSLVTVLVILVAIAFMMNVACESLVKRTVARHVDHAIADSRTAARWVSRLSRPPTQEDVLRELVQATPGSAAYDELRSMGDFGESEFAGLREQAAQAVDYLDFIAALDYAERRLLVHRSRGPKIFERLQDEAHLEQLEEQLPALRGLRFLTTADELRSFLADWPLTRVKLERIREERIRAIAAIEGQLGDRRLIEAMCAMDDAFGEIVRAAGFQLDAETAARIARQARRRVEQQVLATSVGRPEIRSAVARRHDVLPAAVDAAMLWELLSRKKGARWYAEQLAEAADPAATLAVDRMQELAQSRRHELMLLRAQKRAGLSEGGWLGLGERMGWLLMVSMLVCVVGISNAMLMAVAERFREIATLKCLGALDGAIMLMFVIEASLFGLVGGGLGALCGALIGFGRMAVQFGPVLHAAGAAAGLPSAMLGAVVLGVLLATVASIYPSVRAARLAPMEAMRIE